MTKTAKLSLGAGKTLTYRDLKFPNNFSYKAQSVLNTLNQNEPDLFSYCITAEDFPKSFENFCIGKSCGAQVVSLRVPLDEYLTQKDPNKSKQKDSVRLQVARLSSPLPKGTRLKELQYIQVQTPLTPLLSTYINNYCRGNYIELTATEVIQDLRANTALRRKITDLDKFLVQTEEIGQVLHSKYIDILQAIRNYNGEIDDADIDGYTAASFDSLLGYVPFVAVLCNRLGVEQGFREVIGSTYRYLIGHIFDILGYVMGECTPFLSKRTTLSLKTGYVHFGKRDVTASTWRQLADDLIEGYTKRRIMLPFYDNFGNYLRVRNGDFLSSDRYTDPDAKTKFVEGSRKEEPVHPVIERCNENGDIITAIFSHALGFLGREVAFAQRREEALEQFKPPVSKVADFDSAEEMVAALLHSKKRGRPRNGALPPPYVLPEIDLSDPETKDQFSKYQELAEQRKQELLAEENKSVTESRQHKTPDLSKYKPKYLTRPTRLGQFMANAPKYAKPKGNYCLSLEKLRSNGSRIIIDCTTLRSDAEDVDKAVVAKESGKKNYAKCIKVVLVYCESIKFPLMYRTVKGSTNDNQVLEEILEELEQYGHREVVILCDRGFQGLPNRKRFNKLKLSYIFMTQRTAKIDKHARVEGTEAIFCDFVNTTVAEDHQYHAIGVRLENCLEAVGLRNAEGYKLDQDGEVVLDKQGNPEVFDVDDYGFNYAVSLKGTDAIKEVEALSSKLKHELVEHQKQGTDVSTLPQYEVTADDRVKINLAYAYEQVGLTHGVAFATNLDIEDAAKIVHLYSQRWAIEPFFRTMKSIIVGDNEALFCHSYDTICVRIGILIVLTSLLRYVYLARQEALKAERGELQQLQAGRKAKAQADKQSENDSKKKAKRGNKKYSSKHDSKISLQIPRAEMISFKISQVRDQYNEPTGELQLLEANTPDEFKKLCEQVEVPIPTVEYVLEKAKEYRPGAPIVADMVLRN